MKKLFLYISLLISIFIIAYYVALTLYRHSKHKPSEEVLLTDSLIEDYAYGDEFLMPYEPYYDYDAESVNSYIDNKSDSHHTGDKYILGIRDGYVIVFFNDMDTVYEFTDIDAGVLRIVDKEQYEKIEKNITFDSPEELFDFLESLAS